MKCFYYSNIKCPHTRIYDRFMDDVPCDRCTIETDPVKPSIPWASILIWVIFIAMSIIMIWCMLYLAASWLEGPDSLQTHHIESML